MVKFMEAGQFKGVPGTIQRAAIHDQNPLGSFRRRYQTFDPAANPSEAGHLRCAIAGELAGHAVGNFAGVRATGAGVDHGGWFGWHGRILIVVFHKLLSFLTEPSSANSACIYLIQVKEPDVLSFGENQSNL
jgi:hypothetical protein